MFIDCLPVQQRPGPKLRTVDVGDHWPSAYRSIPDLLQQNVPVEYLLVYKLPDPIGMFQIDVDAKGHNLSRVMI